MLPRSGLAARHGITLANAPGLIDPGYRGELRVLLLNTDPAATFEVRPGDRIAQLVLTPFADAAPTEVEALDEAHEGWRGRFEWRCSRLATRFAKAVAVASSAGRNASSRSSARATSTAVPK